MSFFFNFLLCLLMTNVFTLLHSVFVDPSNLGPTHNVIKLCGNLFIDLLNESPSDKYKRLLGKLSTD